MKLFSSINKALRRTSVKVGVFSGLLLAAFGVWFGSSARSVDLGDISDPIYCNSSAIIRCGARSTDVVKQKYFDNSTEWGQHIRNVYQGFGISADDINNLGKTAVAGVVTRDGKVMIGDQVVATNAITAGYVDKQPGSTARYVNNTIYYERAIHVNITAEKSPAFVVMKDNKFDFAIIGTCGNPVSAEPKTPKYTIKKEVQKKGDSAWSKDVTGLKSGDKVTFRVTYWNDGPIDIKNVVQKDQLPEGLKYVDGSLQATVPSLADAGKFFGGGVTIGNNAAGTGVSYTFDAVVAPGESVMECQKTTYKNKAFQSAPGLPNQEDYANVSKECAEKPVFECKSLKVETLERTKFRFTVNYSIEPAQLKKVTYTVTKDGQEVDKVSRDNFDSVDYTQTEAGDYEVSAKIVVTFEGKEYTASGTCEGAFSVEEEQETPVYECTSLTVNKVNRTTFTFIPAANYNNLATFKKAVYTVTDKDDNTVEVITKDNLENVSYSQDKVGTYNVNLVMTFDVDGEEKITTQTCAGSFTVEEEPETPVYECTLLKTALKDGTKMTYVSSLTYKADGGAKLSRVDMDWGDSTAVENIALGQVASFEHTFAKAGTYSQTATLTFVIDGDTDNKKTETCTSKVTIDEEKKPEVLHETGPGSVAGMFAVTSVAGMLAYRFVWLRRMGQ